MSSSAARPRRAPRPVRPPGYSYNPKRIIDFPRRLLFPPNAGVGNVRSFKITPIYDVSLNDVLDGKHLPPLTLKDFEDYLVFEAHSAENLYFICWLRDYTAKYHQWEQAQSALPEEKREHTNADLTISFARARGTFFDPSSHLELNLPGDVVEGLLGETKALAHPNPSMMVDVQKHVEGMLRESLMKFVVGSCRNSGRRRGLFAIAVGFAAILVGLAPVLMSVLRGESRWVRLAALLPFWFGAMTAIAGFHGVCVVIFLFGDARQLYPYELARPTLREGPPMAPLTLPMPVTAAVKNDNASSYIDGRSSDEEGLSHSKNVSLSTPFGEIEQDTKDAIPLSPILPNSQPLPSDPSASTRTAYKGTSFDGYVPETAGFIPPSYAPSITQSQSHSNSGHSHSNSGTVPYKFDFDSLPPPSPRKSDEELERESAIFRERSVFASLTKVFSPVVTRAQWEIIMRSAALGVLVALVIGGVCFAVPFDH